MNNSATGSYGIGPPDWPFTEAAALTQAQSCTKLPCRVLGADGGLALRNFCSLVQTGVGSGCRGASQLRNNFTGKGNESGGPPRALEEMAQQCCILHKTMKN